MRITWVLRLRGLFCIAGGAGLAVLFLSPGGCLGDDCYARPLPGTGRDQARWGLVTVGSLSPPG